MTLHFFSHVKRLKMAELKLYEYTKYEDMSA